MTLFAFLGQHRPKLLSDLESKICVCLWLRAAPTTLQWISIANGSLKLPFEHCWQLWLTFLPACGSQMPIDSAKSPSSLTFCKDSDAPMLA